MRCGFTANVPSEATVAGWIQQAKSLPPAVEH